MNTLIEHRAIKIVDSLLKGAQHITLGRIPGSYFYPARIYENLELVIDINDKSIKLEAKQQNGSDAVSENEYRNIIKKFIIISSKYEICTLSRDDLLYVMQNLLPLADRILRGGTIWFGYYCTSGCYFNEDAEDAMCEIMHFIEGRASNYDIREEERVA